MLEFRARTDPANSQRLGPITIDQVVGSDDLKSRGRGSGLLHEIDSSHAISSSRRTGAPLSWTVLVSTKAIQQMPTQRMSRSQGRVVEGGVRIVTHAETFHDPAGAPVRLGREGNDFIQAERLKGVAQGCLSTFRRIPLAPRIKPESIAKLDAREGHVGRHRSQPDEADEGRAANDFYGPRAVAMAGDVLAGFLHLCGALLEREDGREELTDARVGIECSPRLEIVIAPLSEQQPFRRQHLAIMEWC